ncbi:hypothetical protein PI125_g12021 [Phytophthora idaei]|nr:hypothetical protein PI125_g12021 [Phytophthora idaei]KAG3149508.1 hypothetical protein PI126_g11983 [Phytophthora idaei]
MDLIYPFQLDDISKVEQIINRRIFGERRKKQRDRLMTMRNRDDKRRDQSRRTEPRRDDRRDDRRNRKEEGRDCRVIVAEADSEEEEFNQRATSSYDSGSYWSHEDQSSGGDSAYDSDCMDTGFVNDKSKNTGRRENSARGRNDSSRDRNNSASRPSRPYDRRIAGMDRAIVRHTSRVELAEVLDTRLTNAADTASSASRLTKWVSLNCSTATRS